MKDRKIAARLIDALDAAAKRECGANTALVSVEITMLTRAGAGHIEARLTRKTRTLAFLSAEITSDAGERIASAASVHKLLD